MRLMTLKKRSEFQRVRGGGRWSAEAFVLEGKTRPEQTIGGPRFGFTVTKKLGGAVVRNRIRRRLRAAITELAAQSAEPRFDYVVIARAPSLEQPFAKLRGDLQNAFKRVHAGQAREPGRTGRKAAATASKSRAAEPGQTE